MMLPSLRRNLSYKLISLAIAILCYVIAYTQQNPRISRDVYVEPEVRGLPPKMAVSEPPQGYVLTISGPAAAVDALRTRGIKAVVDVSEVKAGTQKLKVKYDLPPDLQGRVEVRGPTLVPLTLAQKVRWPFAVEVAHEDHPPPGYAYKTPVTVPRRVMVAGLLSDVNRVQRVVANVDTSHAAGAIDDDVDLVAQDAHHKVVDHVEIQPQRARIQLGLKEVPSTKTLVLSPVFQGEVAPGFRFVDYTFEPQTVTVAGPQERLAALTSLTVPVNRRGVSADRTSTVTLALPSGLRVVGSPQVRITIHVQPDAAAPSGAAARSGPTNTS